jgi:DNA-binding transcriptional MerR regulator
MPQKPVKKLYYSISEVAEITRLEPYVLRYWEKEFPELKPQKNRAGNRTYTDKDIKLVQQIMHLLYEDKYTIPGARQQLKDSKKVPSEQMALRLSIPETKNLIGDIRQDVQQLLDLLNSQ